MNSRQDTLTKRRQLSRCNAVVDDDDTKLKFSPQTNNDSGTKNSKSSHSKELSSSFTDSTGVDIIHFIETTLHKNAKDREFLLEIEKQLKEFVLDSGQSYLVFPSLSSYNRMLVHRVGAFFGLLHNVDQSGQKIVVTKYAGTRMPDIAFESLIKHNNFHDNYSSRRAVQSFDESRGRHCPSMREFRARINTTASEGCSTGNMLTRSRRARSFEHSDWYGSNFQQPAQFSFAINRQYSANADPSGERVSSNCSSNASITALPTQLQSLQLPVVQTADQTSLVSPLSTYIEKKNTKQEPGGTLVEGAAATEHDQPATRTQHIPSLFAVQPNPPTFFPLSASQFYPVSGYQTMFPPSTMLGPIAALPNYYSASAPYYYTNTGGPFYYTNPATTYQQQQFFAQTHPLLEDNENQQQLVEQFGAIGLQNNGNDEKSAEVSSGINQQTTSVGQQQQPSKCIISSVTQNDGCSVNI